MDNADKRKKILVVDDEPQILDVLSRMLERKDYAVVTFNNPLDALEYFKKEKVDAIVVDLNMPGADGIWFLGQVQRTQRRVPVIFLTGYATISTAVLAMQNGAFDYLKKPVAADKLCDAVRRATG